MSNFTYPSDISKDFLIEVGLGHVEGFSFVAVIMRNPSCSGTAFTDVWGGGSNFVIPSTSKSLELVFADANDASAGTGARTILVSKLDSNYEPQVQVVTSTAATVALTGTHFRPNNFVATGCLFVITAGSAEANVGAITLQEAGGGNIWAKILAGSGRGDAPSKSEDGILTVPAGVTAIGLKVIIVWPKNQDGEVFASIKPFGAGTARISSGRFAMYQNILDLNYQANPNSAEKTDRSFRAISTNAGVDVTIVQEFLMIENDKI